MPFWGLGVSEKVENIKKDKIREHIEIISQIIEKAQYKTVV